MSTGEGQSQAPHPNKLRELREALGMSREALAFKCRELAAKDSSLTTISVGGIRSLELGLRRPKRATAITLAQAVESTHEAVFTSGLDTTIRNPEGRTRIPPSRPKGGRPKKHPNE